MDWLLDIIQILSSFMHRVIRRLTFGYRVVKKSNGDAGQPLPNMAMYYLQDDDGLQLSFWNDVPFARKGDTVNCCIEVPKQLNNKFEVIKQLPNHPFMQDTKKNVFSKELQLRHYAMFPLFNYGFIPRTWEQNHTADKLGYFGDDDPIDVCDLSRSQKNIGDVYRGKILGCFCLIDQGELDWKILVVDAEQAQCQKINSISDFPREQIQAVQKWFKTIKIYDGKKPNTIAYDQKIFSKDEALDIVTDTHEEWKRMVSSSDQIYQDTRKRFHIEKWNQWQ